MPAFTRPRDLAARYRDLGDEMTGTEEQQRDILYEHAARFLKLAKWRG